MPSLIATWKLIEARAFDDAGKELRRPFGPQPIGTVTFVAERMTGVIGDARPSVPREGPPRFFVAFTGSYRFDGIQLITRADDASRPELIVDQIRDVHFESPDRIRVVPTAGLSHIGRIEAVWERLGQRVQTDRKRPARSGSLFG